MAENAKTHFVSSTPDQPDEAATGELLTPPHGDPLVDGHPEDKGLSGDDRRTVDGTSVDQEFPIVPKDEPTSF